MRWPGSPQPDVHPGTGPEAGTSACPYDSGAPFVGEGDEGPELVATEVSGPECPHTAEETTARTDTLADWIRERAGIRH